jgi:hypothetical protein
MRAKETGAAGDEEALAGDGHRVVSLQLAGARAEGGSIAGERSGAAAVPTLVWTRSIGGVGRAAKP